MELYPYVLILGSIFLVTVYIAFIGIVHNQVRFYQTKTHRLQVLGTRLSMFLPLCCTILYLSLAVKELTIFLQLPLSIIEGVAFYTFLSYIVNIFGSPTATIQAIDHKLPRAASGPIIGFLMKLFTRDATALYRRLLASLYHVLITRPILIIFQVTCGYMITKPGAEAANSIFAIASMAIMMNGFVTLIVFYHRTHMGTDGTGALSKLIIMKMAVLLPVFQDFVCRLFINHAEEAHDLSVNEVRVHQLNDIVLLGEMMVLSFPFYIVFSSPIHNPNATTTAATATSGGAYNDDNDNDNDDYSNNMHGTSMYGTTTTGRRSKQGFHSLWDWHSVALGIQHDGEITWTEFLNEVFHVTDLIGSFSLLRAKLPSSSSSAAATATATATGGGGGGGGGGDVDEYDQVTAATATATIDGVKNPIIVNAATASAASSSSSGVPSAAMTDELHSSSGASAHRGSGGVSTHSSPTRRLGPTDTDTSPSAHSSPSHTQPTISNSGNRSSGSSSSNSRSNYKQTSKPASASTYNNNDYNNDNDSEIDL